MEFKYLLIYLLIINIISFVTAGLDKLLAIKKLRRISEKNLFLLSFLGGAAFMLLSMFLFRHKTKHKRFMVGLPAIIIFQLILIVLSVNNGIFY